MKYCILLLSALCFLIQNSISQYTNFQIFPSPNIQIEPIITKNPANPLVLFASAFTSTGGIQGEGIYISTNGGINWTGTDQNPGLPTNNHAGDPGPIIDKNGVFIITHLGNFPAGMYSNRSTNMGATWENSLLIAGNNQEKGSPGTDSDPSSPYYGRTYLAWSNTNLPNNIIFSYTTNSGSNWSTFAPVNNSVANHSSFGAEVSFGSAGKVYVTWASTIQVSPANEDALGFAYSTNGGANWTVQEQAIPVNGIKNAHFPPWLIRMNGYPYIDVDHTGGAHDGWIYIVNAEINHSPAGSDADVVLHRSTNGGVTWSSGIRVNQDPLNDGKIQFFPIIAVDDMGGLNVVYYDSRNHSLPADSLVDVYLSHSNNGGDNWSDYKISDHSFQPRSATGGFGSSIMGDHIGLTHSNNKLIPVWMDDHNNTPGSFRVWSAIIDIATIGINKIGTEVPKGFSLQQNFPNPFNPSTKIRFEIPNSGKDEREVKLNVYDNTGRNVGTLVNARLQAGVYETDWDASNYASGIYYYRLSADDFTETKKMVLIK